MSTLLEVWQRERKVAAKVGKRTLKRYYLLLKVNLSILYWLKRSYICFKSLTEIGHCHFTETRERKFPGQVTSGKILKLLWPQRRWRSMKLPVHECAFCADRTSLTLLQKTSLGRTGTHSTCPIVDTSWAVWQKNSLYSGLSGMQDTKAAMCWCSGPFWGCVVQLSRPYTP